MLDIFKFIFSTKDHFLGTLLLLMIIFYGIASIVEKIKNKNRY